MCSRLQKVHRPSFTECAISQKTCRATSSTRSRILGGYQDQGCRWKEVIGNAAVRSFRRRAALHGYNCLVSQWGANSASWDQTIPISISRVHCECVERVLRCVCTSSMSCKHSTCRIGLAACFRAVCAQTCRIICLSLDHSLERWYGLA